jgi:hypothetical protein
MQVLAAPILGKGPCLREIHNTGEKHAGDVRLFLDSRQNGVRAHRTLTSHLPTPFELADINIQV